MIVRSSHLFRASLVLLACLGVGAASASSSANAPQASARAKAKVPHVKDKAAEKGKAKAGAKTAHASAGAAKGQGKAKAKNKAGAAPEVTHAVPKPAQRAATKQAAAAAAAPVEAKAVASSAARASAVEARQDRAAAAPAPTAELEARPEAKPAQAASDAAAYPAYAAIPAMTAKEKAAYARLPVCKLSADGTRLAVEPCRTAPPRKDAPHRSVMPQIPRVPTVVEPSNPQLVLPSAVLDSGRAPSPGSASALPGAAGAARDNRPIPVANCTPGGCTDIQGNRYIGSGGILTTPSGKSCTNTGGWIQCN